jgi:hypothetical protein
MAKFIFIYHAPQTPAEATPPSSDQMQRIMAEWMAWGDRVGAGMLDFGTPLDGGVSITPEGSSPATSDVVGYSIIEADDTAAALQLAEVHPHLTMPGGCTIEVHEAQPLPGM